MCEVIIFILCFMSLAVPSQQLRTGIKDITGIYPINSRIPEENIWDIPTFSSNMSSAGYMTPKVLQNLMLFLTSTSPPHQLYILYDGFYQHMDTTLKSLSREVPHYSVIKYSNDLRNLRDVLSGTLTIVNTGRRHFIVFCSLQNVMNLFIMIASKNLENREFWWIVMAPVPKTSDHLQKILREGSNVLVVQMIRNNEFKIYSTSIDPAGSVEVNDVGSWRTNDKASHGVISKDVFGTIKGSYSNFQGRQLTVASVSHVPFFLMEPSKDGALIPVSGFDHSIVKALSQSLNFTYRMVTPADGNWGGPLANGSVTGMIGVVSRREADFAICAITITGVRETVIDFSYPYYIESLTLASRAPAEKSRAFAAFTPFTIQVWLCIAVATLILGPILSLETSILREYKEKTKSIFTMNNFAFNMFRILVNQGNEIESEYLPHKLTFVFWYIFALLISALYSAMLIASLVTPTYEKPINSLSEVPQAISDGFTFCVTAETSDEYMFKEATEGIYKQIYSLLDQKDRSKSFPRSDEAFDRILKGKYVVVYGEISIKFQSMTTGIQRYYFARDTFAPQNYGIPSYSGAPFLPKFNQMISYMKEGGLITKWVNDELMKVAGKGHYEDSAGQKPLTLTHLQGAFYILGFGFSTAQVLLILELIYAKL